MLKRKYKSKKLKPDGHKNPSFAFTVSVCVLLVALVALLVFSIAKIVKYYTPCAEVSAQTATDLPLPQTDIPATDLPSPQIDIPATDIPQTDISSDQTTEPLDIKDKSDFILLDDYSGDDIAVKELAELVTSGRPRRRVSYTPDEYEEKFGELPPAYTAGEDENLSEIVVEENARLAIYCLDIESGKALGYNSDEIFFSASVAKLAFILSLLKRIEVEEEIAQSIDELPEKYNLDTTVEYKKETMFVKGSGEIQKCPDGSIFSYRDLVKYSLLYSDNIAFSILVGAHGYGDLANLLNEIGAKNSSKSFYNTTAADCAGLMLEVYDYIEKGKYGDLLYDCMRRSLQTPMLSNGFYPLPVAHKYGWDKDAYHDTAIVFDEHPFIVVFFSDYDEGSDSRVVTDYIYSLCAGMEKIHDRLYE